MKYSQVRFKSFGYELPPNILTSAEIEQQLAPVYNKLKLPEGRLELMSGIRERRFWDKGTRPSDGATKAGRKALTASNVSADQIDCLIFTSVCRDMMEPASAAFVHRQLGLSEQCQIFDLSNACLGFLNGILMLANMIELGQIKHGLLVAGETAEDLVSSTINTLLHNKSLTRKSIKPFFASLTIGSGAVALVVSKADCRDEIKLLGGSLRANTSQNHLCQGGSGSNNGTIMATDSEELLLRGVETAHRVWLDFLKELDWDETIIANYFCHQVGNAHAKLLMETLQLNQDKNFETLPNLGNVGSVSAPITMAMAIEQGVFKRGSKAAILGIGSGINCLMLGVEW